MRTRARREVLFEIRLDARTRRAAAWPRREKGEKGGKGEKRRKGRKGEGVRERERDSSVGVRGGWLPN